MRCRDDQIGGRQEQGDPAEKKTAFVMPTGMNVHGDALCFMVSQGPTCGQTGYITPAVSGVPSAERGDKIRSSYTTPTILGAPESSTETKSEVAT